MGALPAPAAAQLQPASGALRAQICWPGRQQLAAVAVARPALVQRSHRRRRPRACPRPTCRLVAAPPPAAFPALGAKVKEDDFPDLMAASKVKESKKDKKKKEAKQKLSLTDFLKSDGGSSGGIGIGARRGGDVDLMSLPTAPRQRAEGEEPSRGGPLGGGFREYGGGE